MVYLFSTPLAYRRRAGFGVALLVLMISVLLGRADDINSNTTAGMTCAPAPNSDKTVWLVLDTCEIAGIPGADTVYSWGAKIGITDDQTTNLFCISPSTVINNLFLPDAGICQERNLNGTTAGQCRSRRGNFIDKEASKLTPVDVGVLSSDEGWKTFQNEFQSAAKASLRCTEPATTMDIALVNVSVNSNQGQLGLANNSTFINALKTADKINTRSWGLNSGSINEGPDGTVRQGSLVFGGYDQDSRMESDGWVEVAMDYDEVLGDRYCPLQITIDQIDVEFEVNGKKNKKTLTERARPVTACLEPNDYLPRLPGTMLGQFLDALKIETNIEPVPSDSLFDPESTHFSGTKKSEFLVLEPGLSFQTSLFPDFNMSLFITIRNGPVIEIPSHEMKRPLKGLAGDGSPVVDQNHTEILMFSQPNVGNASSFGRSFLSQVYLFVDLDNRIMRLDAQNKQARAPSPVAWVCKRNVTNSTGEGTNDMNGHTNNTGENWPAWKIAVIVLASVVGVVGLVWLVLWIKKKIVQNAGNH
ncbi:hypothetical protein V8F20_007311 [Naviculisporaceae sp. PSN 640]